jgi:hypothetical protein
LKWFLAYSITKKELKQILIIIIALVFLISCNNQLENRNPNDYPKSKGISLAFDLSTFPSYEAKLIIEGVEPSRNYKYFFPFKVLGVQNNIEVLSSVGNYEKFTLVNFTGSLNSNPQLISLNPDIIEYESSELLSRTPEDGVYFIKNGLERLFIYDYEYINKNQGVLNIDSIKSDSLNFIVIKLPLKSEGKEIENGKTSLPEPLSSNNNIKVFPGTHKGVLKVKYELKTELTKTSWYYLLSKSIILVLVPILELIFSFIIENKKKKFRLTVIFVTIELLLLLVMIFLGYNGQFIGVDKTLDWVTTIIIALLATILMFKKGQKNSP